MNSRAYIKLNPYLYDDKHNILDKMEKVCCDNDCHHHSLSYHKKSPYVLIYTLWHKGANQFNIKYDFKRKCIRFKARDSMCDCLKTDLIRFINDNKHKIHYHFKKEILPINSALIENKSWKTNSRTLREYMCNDTIGIVKQYLCYFRECSECGVEIFLNSLYGCMY